MFDIKNIKFNKLTAIKFIERRGGVYYWLFKCDCGKEKIISRSSVTSGHTKSCGCERCFFKGKKRLVHSIMMSGSKNPMFGIKRTGENNPNWKGINIIERKKEYRKKSRERINKNPHLKIRKNVSSLMLKRLRNKGISKRGNSTFKSILNYNIIDLKNHLESLFEPWMNWCNYGSGKGKWCIDHIKSDCLFKYKSINDAEFKECWSLKNLRPLDFIENIKRNKNLKYERTITKNIADTNTSHDI